jgi:hypothetical protein
MGSDFLGVETVEARTSMGPVRLPILYADGTAMLAFFWVDPVQARRLLEGSGLEPLRFPGRRALLALGFYDYRETTIGPYHEVGSALAVVPAGAPSSGLAVLDLLRAGRRRRAGFRILDLPVSAPFANAGGRELWGLPKFLTQIPLRVDAADVDGQVLEPGGAAILLRLTGAVRWRWPGPALDLVLYSDLNGRRLRTVVPVRGRFRFSSGNGVQLGLGPGRHRMAENLRALGVDGAHPFAVGCCLRYRARFHAGEPA